LAKRGPEVLRPLFENFVIAISKNGDFNTALHRLKSDCGQPGSDQIFESISISKALGGSELLTILRTVGTFLRQDLALRREIEVKHGWIKNSAHLSAAAPWVLLLLLSTQPATARAFSTSSGAVVLIFGVAMTSVAYMWMAKLGELPRVPRVFGAQ
jgi:tight adherence protein B